jgi:DNA anti-recombination protein RmuC
MLHFNEENCRKLINITLPLNVLGRHFMETESLKREFLELLDKDLEFRYAVAGCLGLSEILERLDSLTKEQVNLRKEQVKLGREQIRLREEQTKIWNEIAKVWEGIAKLREDMVAGFRRHDEEIAKLRSDMVQGFRRHDEELVKLREDFNRAYRRLDSRLSRVERTLEKMMLDVEEEARIVVKYRLRDMGYDVDVNPLILPGMELNIYGVAGDMCIIGEASVRAAQNLIDEINHNEDEKFISREA